MASITTHLLGIAIITVGIVIATLSPETLLRFDGKTGYAVYSRELERSGSRESALRAAGWFYRMIGGLFVLFGSVWLLTSIYEAGLFSQIFQ
jgi:hypothetical protein